MMVLEAITLFWFPSLICLYTFNAIPGFFINLPSPLETVGDGEETQKPQWLKHVSRWEQSQELSRLILVPQSQSVNSYDVISSARMLPTLFMTKCQLYRAVTSLREALSLCLTLAIQCAHCAEEGRHTDVLLGTTPCPLTVVERHQCLSLGVSSTLSLLGVTLWQDATHPNFSDVLHQRWRCRVS